ncbi:hypothetical protein F4804DRAFT_349499 [Jackrogersella minutella]|nr:hypothetical protein F4804DRAFT_349499 [Jackrogersella minutella]
MYHRNSTKFHRIDRQKSTSSAKSVHLEHISPETAERDAHAAATKAFARAKERSSTEATLWPPPRNTDSSDTSGYDGTPDRRSNDSAIRRQQSVRFVQEKAPKNPEICKNFENTTHAWNTNTANVDIDKIDPRPMTSASAAGMVSAAKGTAGDYINTFFTADEYCTPEDDIASAPSSYRRIRKSRSMFTCSEASMNSRNHVRTPTSTTINHVPSSSAGSLTRGADERVHSIKLKAPKSMSFLRGRRDQPMLFSRRRGSAPFSLSNNGNAVTSNSRDRIIKSQPSPFLRSKPNNADKYFKKSMREDSNETLLIDGKIPKDGSLRVRARKVSHNFKHKLKNFFSLVKGDADEAVFPPQQVEASKSHITTLSNFDYMKSDEFRLEPTSDEAALSRVPSGVPSLHAVPSHQQLRSRQGSVESLKSERRASDERSRVTSWTNSDTNTINTLNSHMGEWERQRLSVIKENGMHISSSSARSPEVTTHVTDSLLPPIPPPATVDSQRIYSALMKRLSDTNKHQKKRELKSQKSVNNFITASVIPPRGSSRVREGRGAKSPATIRHVVSDGLSESSSAGTIERKPVASTRRAKTKPNESPFRADSTSPGLPSSISASLENETKRSINLGGTSDPIPFIEEPTPPARTLSTRSSAFFASPTCHLFRTRSPYRRALQDSIRTESQTTQLRSPEFNPWMRSLTGLPIRCPSTCESEVDKKMQYAESIYSSTTDEQPMESLNNVSAVCNFPKPSNIHGDATIFVSPPVYRPTPPPVPKHRVTSSASSVEWKTWLSANVSKLEGTPDHADMSILKYKVPSSRTTGHIRENAQIHDEDEQPPLEVYKPTRPDSVLATIEQNARASPQAGRPTLKSVSPNPHCEKENEIPERHTTQSRNALRTTPSLASMRSAREVNPSSDPTRKGAFDSIPRKSLAHRPSLNTLAGNQTSARKLVKRQIGSKKYVTPTPSPGPKATADNQFRKLGGSSSSRRRFALVSKKTENVSPNTDVDVDDDINPYGVQGSGVFGSETDLNPQSIGSKEMVDLFLSSRRKRMASSEDGGVFI